MGTLCLGGLGARVGELPGAFVLCAVFLRARILLECPFFSLPSKVFSFVLHHVAAPTHWLGFAVAGCVAYAGGRAGALSAAHYAVTGGEAMCGWAVCPQGLVGTAQTHLFTVFFLPRKVENRPGHDGDPKNKNMTIHRGWRVCSPPPCCASPSLPPPPPSLLPGCFACTLFFSPLCRLSSLPPSVNPCCSSSVASFSAVARAKHPVPPGPNRRAPGVILFCLRPTPPIPSWSQNPSSVQKKAPHAGTINDDCRWARQQRQCCCWS